MRATSRFPRTNLLWLAPGQTTVVRDAPGLVKAQLARSIHDELADLERHRIATPTIAARIRDSSPINAGLS